MRKEMTGPLVWFGGKGQIVNKLLDYVPEHTFYAEVFGGGAAMLFAKKPSEYEMYNDLDSGVVNFFRVLRDRKKFERFYELVNLTPFSREEFYKFRDEWEDEKDEVVKAYKFFIVARWSFSGHFGQSMGIAKTVIRRELPANISKWLSIVDRLPKIAERLLTVIIENQDFKDIFKYYISKWSYDNSFVYLDPPYLPEVRKGGNYRIEMNLDDHIDLLELLQKHSKNAKFMLSGYNNSLYDKYLTGWRKICFDVPNRASKAIQGKKMRREVDCIWMNY